MTYYKVLVNGKSCHGGDLEWSLPTQNADGTWTPGAWHEVKGEIQVCHNGLHLTTEPYDKWMKWDAVVYEAEGEGDSDIGDDKTAFRRARLLRPAPVPEWWTAAHDFVASIKDVTFYQPDGDPDPAWKLFTASTRAEALNTAMAAARDAALDASRDVTLSATWDATPTAKLSATLSTTLFAAWDAAGAASLTVARVAARDAALNAARDAALNAAGAATWDARLMVLMAITSDLNIAQEHRDHAAARWRVWQKGYALLGGINGVLYVYAAESAVLA